MALWKNPFKFPWICLSTLRHLLSFGWSKRVQLQGFVEPTNGGQKYVRNRNSDRTIFFCVLLECREGLRRVALQSASRRAVGHTKTDLQKHSNKSSKQIKQQRITSETAQVYKHIRHKVQLSGQVETNFITDTFLGLRTKDAVWRLSSKRRERTSIDCTCESVGQDLAWFQRLEQSSARWYFFFIA